MKWESFHKREILDKSTSKLFTRRNLVLSLGFTSLIYYGFKNYDTVILEKIIKINKWILLFGGVTYASILLKRKVSKYSKYAEYSKQSGHLLGLAIALGLVFPNQTLSFVGYSFGSEAVKSCLQTLYDCGATNIVHEVLLMAGTLWL